MAVHRTKPSQRTSPEVEKLVADAISLAASGSQIEDRYWEDRLNVRLMRLLKSQNQNVIDAALDQTFRINTVAFEVLADTAETLAESQDGVRRAAVGCAFIGHAHRCAYALSNTIGTITCQYG